MMVELKQEEFKTYDAKYVPWFFITLGTLGLIMFYYPEVRIAALTVITAIFAFNVAVAVNILYHNKLNTKKEV